MYVDNSMLASVQVCTALQAPQEGYHVGLGPEVPKLTTARLCPWNSTSLDATVNLEREDHVDFYKIFMVLSYVRIRLVNGEISM